ncbi:hypothetical protein SAY87_001416 [Trapa incisa]|uniref:DUF7815 domain-containing protein n=1 Tax=Trapa incisa TaxID=236973 RepID=A0AAN7GIH7_9MYRT|nr:hypothetical protein SAY87_001416 [Trapa incisa]
MPYPIPLDTIHRLQISLREEAKIPSYDPTDPQLPKLPSLEHSISQLEPSPPYLRCKHCKGRLIRGIKSLFCVFCGKEQFGEIPPDPINFRSTTGYRWLLESLQFDGSKILGNYGFRKFLKPLAISVHSYRILALLMPLCQKVGSLGCFHELLKFLNACFVDTSFPESRKPWMFP